ncbi:MAG: HAMP domain-containing protein [Gammaproteobacteria bacterium]|nr:HAMP domain-containing protein [Gammaproteobacteria bacterium]
MSPAEPSRRTFALSTWLGGGSVLIVILALAAMALGSSVLVHRQTERQARARAELAVSAARDFLRRAGEDALNDARALAERPALARMAPDLQERRSLEYLLQGFCASNRLSSCALLTPDGTLITGGAGADWAAVRRARAEQGERYALAPRDGSTPLLGAAAQLTALPGAETYVLRALDAPLLEEAGREIGATLRITNFVTYQAPDADPLTPLHTRAIGGTARPVARVAALDSYVAASVLTNTTGEPIALLDALLPTAGFAAMTRTYDRLLLLITCVVALLAGLAGLYFGRWLAAPVAALADMAHRIGKGDFTPPVPTAEPRELAALGAAMDGMRQSLVELTGSLRRSEAETRAVLGGVVEGVFVVDTQRLLHYANPQFLRMIGLESGQALGRFCGDLLHPTLPAAERPCDTRCPILAARTSGVARCAEQLQLADGTTRAAVVVSAAPTDGRQVQLLRDETELEAARRARDSVLGNISHEFRTPLAAQLAAVEMLRDGLDHLDRAAQVELLANVERGGVRLLRLIDNLLESVRIEAGQLAIRHQDVDLAGTVHEAAELIGPLLTQRRLRLEIALPAPQPDGITGDAQRLVQVWVNLLANAIKFAPEGSTIGVGGAWRDSDGLLWVEDAGPGVPAGDPATLFERFQRADGSEPDAPGLGLGLWIVRSIVERHAGRVGVERTPQARTRFWFTLPRGAQS